MVKVLIWGNKMETNLLGEYGGCEAVKKYAGIRYKNNSF